MNHEPTRLQNPGEAHNIDPSYLSKIASLEARIAVLEKENSGMRNQIMGLSPPETLSSSSSTSKRKSPVSGDATEGKVSDDTRVRS